MNSCPFCQQTNRPGVLVCEHCHRSLYDSAEVATRQIVLEPTATEQPWHGSSAYDPTVRIIIYVRGEAKPIVLPIQPNVYVGRERAGHTTDLDLNLTPYGAYEKGVSTQHAVLERTKTDLLLRDLGSTNGTYQNSRKLSPHQAVSVRDGDVLQFGGLVVRLYLETTACAGAGADRIADL